MRCQQCEGRISIHALREEGDQIINQIQALKDVFLSTPSARRATQVSQGMQRPVCDFYPRPPRGGRPMPFRAYVKIWNISIHALREEGDRGSVAAQQPARYFYPRPPRGGRLCGFSIPWQKRNFYPRPPRGGRPPRLFQGNSSKQISIHALREEGDPTRRSRSPARSAFLSTPSARRATGSGPSAAPHTCDFYPRPPRGGRLICFCVCYHISYNFYPRPPRGGRRD